MNMASYSPHSKNDTFTVEGVNADLLHYIPTLSRRSRCFPRKLENLAAVLSVFVRAYNRFGIEKARFALHYPNSSLPSPFSISFNSSFGHSDKIQSIAFAFKKCYNEQ